MRRALIVVDDRPEAGLGHVIRMDALGDELRLRGWGVDTIGMPPVGFFDRRNADVLICDTATVIRGDGTSVAITDTPGIDASGVGLLVCGSAGATPEMFKDSGTKKVLAGPQYALLRDAFHAHREQGHHGQRSGIFDARNISGMTATWIASEMQAAAVVITHAGMRAMEAACVGAPMVVVARNEGERLNANGLVFGGAARSCADSVSMWTPEGMAYDLLDNPMDLADMSAAGLTLVDGLGCMRIADEIEALGH